MFSRVERSTGRKLKTLRTDNGGEYVSVDFETCLKKEGVRHELTVPKSPEQNGVSERVNRTLVEAVRSMLADSYVYHIASELKRCQQPCTCEIEVQQLQWKGRLPLKPGQDRNQMWDFLEFSDVLRMLM